MFIKKRFLIYLVLFMFVVSVVYASDWVYSPGEINVNIFENYSNWNRSDSNLYPFHSTDNLKIPTLSNCDTIDTDANGVMSCGSDATAAGADPTLWKKLNATNFINIYLPHFWNKDNNDTSAILTQLSSNITRGDLITPDNGTWASNYGNVTDNDQIANSAGYTTNTGDITAITEDGTTPLTFSGCDTGSCAIGMDDVLTQAEFDVVVINRTLDEISKFINTSGFNYSIDLSSYISDASSYQLISNAWNKANNDTSNYLIQLGLNITRGDLITPDNTTWAGEYGNVTLVSQLDNDANYLTSYTETDPIMSALNGSILFTWNMSHIGNVTDNDQIANSAGYITSYTDTLSSTAQHVTNITDYTGGRNITLITGDENITATLSGNTYTLHFVTSILLTYLKTIFERTSTSWNLANNDTSATLTQLSSNVTRGDLITPDNGTWASKYGNVTLVSQLACSNCIQLAELDVGDVSDDIAGDIASGELNDNIILDDDLDLTDITLADFTNDRTDLYNDNNATYSFGNRTGDNISFVGGRLWLNLSCEQFTGVTDCSKINESVDLSGYISDASAYQIEANAWSLDDNDTSASLTQLGLNITRGDLITPDNGTWAGEHGNVTDNDQIANSAGYLTSETDSAFVNINDSIIFSWNDTWAIKTVNDSIKDYYNHSIDLSGYSTGVHTVDSNASTACNDNEVLLGEGTCYDLGNIQNSTRNRTGNVIYAQLSDLNDQPFATTNTPQPLNFSTEDEIYGLIHSTTVDSSEITIVNSAIYSIIAQPQVSTGAGGAGTFHMWLEKYDTTDWINVSNTNVELVLASNEENVIPLIVIIKLEPDEKIRVMGSVSDTAIKLDAQSPAGEPVIPSIIFSMSEVGGTNLSDIDTRAKTDNDILYNDSDTHYFNKTSFGEEFNQTFTGDENITITKSGNAFTFHFVTSILLTYFKTIFERTSTAWNLANNDTSATLTQLSSNITRGDLITPDNETWAREFGNVTLVSQLACSNCIQLAELDVGDVSDDIAGDIASGELNDNIILDDDLDLTDITLADFTNDRTDLYNDNNATYSFGNRTGDNISFVGGRLWLNLSCEQLTGTTDCSKINESVDLSSYISDASSYQLIANAWTLDDNDTSNYLTQLGLNITRGDLITPDNGTWAGKYGNVTDNDQIANSAGYTTNTGDITAITEDGTTPLTFSGCDTGSCVIGMDDVLTQAEFDVVVINRTEDEIGNLANSSLLNHIINSISVLVINRTLDEIADEANSSLINYIINSIDVLVINRTDDEIGDLANSSLLNHIQNNNDTVTSLLDRKNESLLALSQFDNDEGFITIDTRAKTDNDILYNDSDTHYFNKTSFGEEFNQTFTGDENITITKSGNNFAFHFVTNILLTFLKTVFYDSEGDLTGLLDDDYVDVDEAPSAADIEGNFGAGLTIVAGAVDDAEMDYGQVTLVDFTNDPKFVSNNTPVVFTNITITETNNTIGNFSIIQFNSSCTGFRMGATGGGLFSCT